MTTFAVTREAGPAWAQGGISDQPAVSEHAAFMRGLVEIGFVSLGGPLAGSDAGRVRVLLVVNAENEAEIRTRLAEDPWEETGQIRTVGAESWQVLVGDGELARSTPGPSGRLSG